MPPVSFGGHDVDLRGTRLDPSGATLPELRGYTLFGGTRVTTSPAASWSGTSPAEGKELPPAADVAASAEPDPIA